MSKKYHLQTFGCQMNKNDSERITALLNSLGLKSVSDPSCADLLLVNTCAVRQSAEDRVFGIIKNWQKFRIKKPNLIIAVTGCMPGRDKNGKIKNKIPGVDLWFGIDDLSQLPKWLIGLSLIPLVCNSKQTESLTDYLQITPNRENKFQVFISIQTGCNNFCTYCVVPTARGRERNRKLVDILAEVKEAVRQGAKEIILLGQVVNNYQASDIENFSASCPLLTKEGNKGRLVKDHFSALLWEINQIPGEFRIHFTAPDPQYFSNEQIEALTFPKQVNFLHLPAQSGDDEILKKMNRHYTRAQYITLIKKIRQVKPDISLATDIIVGFCGETKEQFKNTVDLYKQCDFDISYHAQYSERSGTTAVKMFKDDVLQSEKKRRWNELQKIMLERTFQKNQKYQDKIVRVLVDNVRPLITSNDNSFVILSKAKDLDSSALPQNDNNDKNLVICTGNSDDMKLCQFLGSPDMVGTFQKIKITQPLTWILKGVISE